MARLRRLKRRAEFAGDEGVQGAEAGGKLDGGQAALAAEPAEKVRSGAAPFEGVALETAGDEVAVGIILDVHPWDYVVEAAHLGCKPAPAVKTTAAFPDVDGPTAISMFEEVELLEGVVASGDQRAGGNWSGAGGRKLLGQANLDHVTLFAAFYQAQDTAGDEAADGPAHGVVSEAGTTSEPRNGKAETTLSFEAAVTEEMRIDDAVRRGQAQTRRKVLELFPRLFGVWFFVCHG